MLTRKEIQRHLFLGPSTPRFSSKFEDSDSGTGSSNEAHVIRHIDRNILACQICQQRYKEPKVSIAQFSKCKLSKMLFGSRVTKSAKICQ